MAQQVRLPGQKVIGVIPPGELAEIGIVQPVPILETTWFDERQACVLVHDYLAGEFEGHFEQYRTCSSYAAGVCRGTGGAGLLCMFHEPEGSAAWQRARSWERVTTQDGSTALRRRRP